MAAADEKINVRPNYHIIEERLCLAPYQCPSCKKLFYTTSDLDRHLNMLLTADADWLFPTTKTKKLYKCIKCIFVDLVHIIIIKGKNHTFVQYIHYVAAKIHVPIHQKKEKSWGKKWNKWALRPFTPPPSLFFGFWERERQENKLLPPLPSIGRERESLNEN